MKDFIRDNKIRIKCIRDDHNPNMEDSCSSNMDHWKCVLKRPSHQMTTYFSMGFGHNGKEPKVLDVLDCLVGDAATIENARDFEEWAGDLGYDTDSRKAEKTYKACKKISYKLREFLGRELYNTVLWDTERE